jgi:hypothetical protein
MDFPIKVIVQNKGKVTLSENSYIAAGGQGTVCKEGAVAYKIYHDSAKMIPLKKIEELQMISHLDNILGPRNIILDEKGNHPVGFTMPYKNNTEFLTRLFNRNYRTTNNISPEMIVDLVKRLQQTISEIHKKNILIVDLNELNFLTDMNVYKEIFFIDIDSYQTPSFPANALMESVRDRKMKSKMDFNTGTDWYSFAIVSFMMYMTYHPYQKGKHSKYGPNDWSVRMDKGLSVLHSDITPKGIWADFSPIPKPHMEWYKAVFNNGTRTAPPLPDRVLISGPVSPTLITGNESFVIEKKNDYPEKIIAYYFFNGFNYILTKKGIYRGYNKLADLSVYSGPISLAAVQGADVVKAVKGDNQVNFEDLKGNQVGYIYADAAMQYNGSIYTINNNKLTQNSFTFLGGNVRHTAKVVGNIFGPATKLYPGIAIQDIIQKCWVCIPYEKNKCHNGKIPELDAKRILDAKFENRTLLVITESKGKYSRYVFIFNEDLSSYTCREEKDINYEPINFTCLSNGVCISCISDDCIEIFKSNNTIKKVPNPPITTDIRLVNDSTGVLFYNKKDLYSLKLK